MLLELKNIRKSFLKPHSRERIPAVDGVDLAIREHENLGLVGESGSGKTTLGRLALKLYTPDQGKIFFSGQEVTNLSAASFRPFRRRMQMVFQDPWNSLDPRYSIEGILAEALGLLPKMSRLERQGRMEEVLQAVGLSPEVLNRFPHEFSGGERQRIAISRALLMQPELLILDEAVSALDVMIQAQILDLLKRLQQQFSLTFWFISHNLRAVRTLCPRTAVMCQGKIVEVAATEDLFKNPQHPYTQELLRAAIEYRVRSEAAVYRFAANSQLIQHGNGHFVLS